MAARPQVSGMRPIFSAPADPDDGSDGDTDDGSDVDMEDESVEETEEEDYASTTSSDASSTSEAIDLDVFNIPRDAFRDAFESLGQREPVPLPPTPVPPLRPAPPRLPNSGVRDHVQWIPFWCDPAWDDQYFLFEDDLGDVERAKAMDLDKLRPALLPRDVLRNPTPYAKRFGIHRDEVGGRSRLSPSVSNTRRTQLSHAEQTMTGRKDYVTLEDIKKFVAPANPFSVRGYLETLLETPGEDTEQVQAYVQLLDVIEQDEALQYAAFSNTTTDDRISHGVHSVDDSALLYDLDGPLHPLVERSRWVSTVGHGTTPDEPRLHWNFHGVRGEWAADDENTWKVIQPALQIVTRVLNTNHPFWLAVLDPKSHMKIDLNRIPLGPGARREGGPWVSITTCYDPALPVPTKSPASKHTITIDQYNFDLPRAVAALLQERVTWEFTTIYESWKKGTYTDHLVWGSASTQHLWDPSAACIRIQVAAEMAWPLLVQDYTPREKASCTLMLVSTMLHELSHAAHYALTYLLRFAELKVDRKNRRLHDDATSIRQLDGLDYDLVLALADLGQDLGAGDAFKREPFFEDDARQELGFAFEKQLWGGRVDTATDSNFMPFHHISISSIALKVDDFPYYNTAPYTHQEDLLNSALPVDGIGTLLPADCHVKLLNQKFWDHELRKYGHQALKLNPETPGLAVLSRGYHRRKDLIRAFGKRDGDYVHQCLRFLRALGAGYLWAYCRALMYENLESVWIRKRLHYDCRTWAARGQVLENLMKDFEDQSNVLWEAFQRVNTPEADKLQIIDQHNQEAHQAFLQGEVPTQPWLNLSTYNTGLVNDIEREFWKLVVICNEVHQACLFEIRRCQSVVVDYIQQEPDVRQVLYDRYCQGLFNLIEDPWEKVIERLVSALRDLVDVFLKSGALTAMVIDEINRVSTNLILDLNHFGRTKAFLREENIRTGYPSWEGQLETVPRGRAKKLSETMERQATKEFNRAKETVRALVTNFLHILDVPMLKVDQEGRGARAERHIRRRFERVLETTPRPDNTTVRTPEQTGMIYAQPQEVTVRPWVAAPTPSPSARGLLFGRPGTPASPAAQTPFAPPSGPGSGFGRYATLPTSSPWGDTDVEQARATSVLRQQQPPRAPTSDPTATMFPPPDPNSRPATPFFPSAYADPTTLTVDLEAAGVAVQQVRNVLGGEVYERRKAEEEALRKQGLLGPAPKVGTGFKPWGLGSVSIVPRLFIILSR